MSYKTPVFQFSKTHVPSGHVFLDILTSKNFPNWEHLKQKDIPHLVADRIAYLNKCMPDDWFYASIGWQLVDVEQERNT